MRHIVGILIPCEDGRCDFWRAGAAINLARAHDLPLYWSAKVLPTRSSFVSPVACPPNHVLKPWGQIDAAGCRVIHHVREIGGIGQMRNSSSGLPYVLEVTGIWLKQDLRDCVQGGSVACPVVES